MLGTAFSVIIRIELAAPGAQLLQENHQLFNSVITAHALIMSTPFHYFLLTKLGGLIFYTLQDN